jgi:DTW domain-containing protein YfiP
MAIHGSSLVDHGTREAPVGVPLLRTLPAPVYLLYPDGEPPAAPPAGPISLVVLDGSWPQARRMLQRIPEVRGLPRLALPPPAVARPRLRRGRDAGEMSTLEAIACAIAFVEGEAMAAPLFALHDLFVERSIPAHDRKRQANRQGG